MKIWFPKVGLTEPTDRFVGNEGPLDRVMSKSDEIMLNEMFEHLESVEDFVRIMEYDDNLYHRMKMSEPIYFPKIKIETSYTPGVILTPEERIAINTIAILYRDMDELYKHFNRSLRGRQSSGGFSENMEEQIETKQVGVFRFKRMPVGNMAKAFVGIVTTFLMDGRTDDMPANYMYRCMGSEKLISIATVYSGLTRTTFQTSMDGLMANGFLRTSFMGNINFPEHMLIDEQRERIPEACTGMKEVLYAHRRPR